MPQEGWSLTFPLPPRGILGFIKWAVSVGVVRHSWMHTECTSQFSETVDSLLVNNDSTSSLEGYTQPWYGFTNLYQPFPMSFHQLIRRTQSRSASREDLNIRPGVVEIHKGNYFLPPPSERSLVVTWVLNISSLPLFMIPCRRRSVTYKMITCLRRICKDTQTEAQDLPQNNING